MSVACWMSFCPKTATSGWTMLNSFATTVSTPVKWPGRAAPSHRDASDVGTTVTARPAPIDLVRLRREQQVDAARLGQLRIAARGRADSGRNPRSGPNCSGLTKMLMHDDAARSRARSTSARCPSCSAPIVGTSAIRSPRSPRLRQRGAQRLDALYDLHDIRRLEAVLVVGIAARAHLIAEARDRIAHVRRPSPRSA